MNEWMSRYLRELLRDGEHLRRQLARGRDDQHADEVPARVLVPTRHGGIESLQETLQNGQQVRGGLAAARLGEADEVHALQLDGDGLALDGRGVLVPSRE